MENLPEEQKRKIIITLVLCILALIIVSIIGIILL